MLQILKEDLHDAGQLTVVTRRGGFRLTSTTEPEKIWTQLRRGVIDFCKSNEKSALLVGEKRCNPLFWGYSFHFLNKWERIFL